MADSVDVDGTDIAGIETGRLIDVSDNARRDGAIAWAMVDASPDALVMADEQGVIELVNIQAERLFGYDRSEMLGQPVEMLLPDRLNNVHKAHRTRFRASPEVRTMGSGMDLLALRADGTELPVEVSLSPLQSDGGLRIIAAVRDISDRVAAEAQSHLIQRTIDAAHDGVFMFPADEMMTFVYANQGATDQTGYSEAELLTMSPLHIKPEFTAASFRETIGPLIEGEVDRLTLRTVHRRKDGRDVPVEVIVEYPASSTTSSVRLMVAFVRDITERLEAQRMLAASETRFRAAFKGGPVPMTITTMTPETQPIIVSANQAAAGLLGYGVDELVGMACERVVHPEDHNGYRVRLKQLSDGQPAEPTVLRFLRADGALVWVRHHMAPMDNYDGSVTAIGHLVDITSEMGAARSNERHQELKAAVSEVRHAMLEGSSRSEGFQLICERAQSILNASAVMVLSSTGVDHDLRTDAAVGVTEEQQAMLKFRSDEGVVGSVFATGNAELTEIGDPRISAVNAEIAEQQQAGSLLMAPFFSADGVIGALLATRTRDAEPLGDTDLVALERFMSAAVGAIELAEIREAQGRLELIDDRERIGRDMHDKVIGRLFATGMAMQATLSRVEDPVAKQRLNKVVDDIDEAIKDIRTTVFGLRAGVNWARGNKGVILALAADQNDHLGFEPTVSFLGPIDELPDQIMGELLATMSEAFTNIARHAHPTAVTLAVAAENQQVRMKLEDNGVGFDTTAFWEGRVPDSDGMLRGNGLGNITSRAEALGGRATIVSALGAGTSIDWIIPWAQV